LRKPKNQLKLVALNFEVSSTFFFFFVTNTFLLKTKFIISAQERLGVITKQREIYIGIRIGYQPNLKNIGKI